MKIENYENQNLTNELDIKKQAHRDDALRYLKGIERNHYNSVSSHVVMRFICFLQNWCIYKNYDADNFYFWFWNNQDDFIERLNAFLETETNRQNIKYAFGQVLKAIETAQNLKKQYFYSEFLDDLNMILGYTTKNKYYNFLHPNLDSKEGKLHVDKFAYMIDRMQVDTEYRKKVSKRIEEIAGGMAI